MLKIWNIWDCNHDILIDQVIAGTEKSALKRFFESHITSTGMYEYTREDRLHLRSSFGSDYIAVMEGAAK